MLEIVSGDIWSMMRTVPPTADLVIGGFPCQDISVNGKGKGVDGARSGLYRAMIEVVRKVQPRMFVAENVGSLLKPRKIRVVQAVRGRSEGRSGRLWL